MNKRRILLGLANYSLLILSCLFYWLGYRLWMIFFMLQLFLTALNFNIARSKKSLAVWSTHLLISTITANLASTLLYYNIISSDSMSMALGLGATIFGTIFVLILSTISIIIKKNTDE
ncbi:MAG: hypothetical protein J6C26_05355 [Clostridia bacterium]|nr:hypothetical protein [Clostridia bacterium]